MNMTKSQRFTRSTALSLVRTYAPYGLLDGSIAHTYARTYDNIPEAHPRHRLEKYTVGVFAGLEVKRGQEIKQRDGAGVARSCPALGAWYAHARSLPGGRGEATGIGQQASLRILLERMHMVSMHA